MRRGLPFLPTWVRCCRVLPLQTFRTYQRNDRALIVRSVANPASTTRPPCCDTAPDSTMPSRLEPKAPRRSSRRHSGYLFPPTARRLTDRHTRPAPSPIESSTRHRSPPTGDCASRHPWAFPRETPPISLGPVECCRNTLRSGPRVIAPFAPQPIQQKFPSTEQPEIRRKSFLGAPRPPPVKAFEPEWGMITAECGGTAQIGGSPAAAPNVG